MSTAGADGVSRPAETKLTPVSARKRMLSRVTPPEASSGTRPATSRTASRSCPGSILWRRSRSAPPCSDLRRVYIVEQQPVRPGGKRRLDLVDAVHLDLDLQARVRRLRLAH